MRAASPCVEPLDATSSRSDAELEAFFAACPTSFVQQTSHWRRVITGMGQDEPLYLGCRSGATLVGVLPAYRFAGPLGAVLTSCAQAGALGGVACLPEADARAVYAALIGGFLELARARDCALATLLTSPLWPDRELCERLLEPDYVLENRCQVLDLRQDVDDAGHFVSGTKHLRHNLRRADASRFRLDERQTQANLDEWYAIHAERQREIGVVPLPRALFAGALAELVPAGKARFIFLRAADSGALATGGLFIHHGAVVDMLMVSGRSEFLQERANYLLYQAAIGWSRGLGLRWFNWQASPPGSGVERYKRSWGSRDLCYAYLTRVTGDVRPFLASSVQQVRDGYRWHYALPFDRIGSPPGSGASSRDAAWRAAEDRPR